VLDLVPELVKRIDKATEDDMLALIQYIDVMYSYNDISKTDYKYLRELINDRLEPMLHK